LDLDRNKSRGCVVIKKEEFISFNQYGWHKGFYKNDDIMKTLCQIRYTDFFEYPDDDEFPYDSAHSLLRGSCNHFAVFLQKVLGYNPYIIEEINSKSFHAFCQICKKGTWYYVDVRGVTSSFDEFMVVASEFVRDEYAIRPATSDVIEKWESNSNYNEEAYAFAEAVISRFKDCYTL